MTRLNKRDGAFWHGLRDVALLVILFLCFFGGKALAELLVEGLAMVPIEIRQSREHEEFADELRLRAEDALLALGRSFIGPHNSRAAAMMGPWHRGLYLSYTNFQRCGDWLPMPWQVGLLEEMVRTYCPPGTCSYCGASVDNPRKWLFGRPVCDQCVQARAGREAIEL